MFLTACGPNRSASCAKYRLWGATGFPGESKIPSGRFGLLSNGCGAAMLAPVHPIAQLTAPGGFWM
jgi:hypothetical protein